MPSEPPRQSLGFVENQHGEPAHRLVVGSQPFASLDRDACFHAKAVAAERLRLAILWRGYG